MPRLDVEKAHKRIRSEISNPAAVNSVTSVESQSKYTQKTGRTRIPPGADGTSPKVRGQKPPSVNTDSSSAYNKDTTFYVPTSAAGALMGGPPQPGDRGRNARLKRAKMSNWVDKT